MRLQPQIGYLALWTWAPGIEPGISRSTAGITTAAPRWLRIKTNSWYDYRCAAVALYQVLIQSHRGAAVVIPDVNRGIPGSIPGAKIQ